MHFPQSEITFRGYLRLHGLWLRSSRMEEEFKENKAAASAVPIEAILRSAGLPKSSFRYHWLWGLLLVLAISLAYAPVWHAGFIWDDDLNLATNPCIAGPLGLKEIWTTSAGDICPLTFTTFWVEHAWWGLSPLPYHLVNVLLHALSAVLLWRILRRLHVPGAWLGAALWGIHPVEVESVAWITELKNTQSGLFFLLSILFFVRWLASCPRRTPYLPCNTSGVKDLVRSVGNGWNYGLTLFFAALSMASKCPTAILITYSIWPASDHWRCLGRPRSGFQTLFFHKKDVRIWSLLLDCSSSSGW